MARSMDVMGRTLVLTGETELGVAIEEPSAMIRFMPHEFVFRDSESGPDLPKKIVYTGRTAIISATLGDCDDAEIRTLMDAPGSSASGELGTLGDEVDTFPITLEPVRSGMTSYTFPHCRFAEEWTNENWGTGLVRRWSLVFQAFPDPEALQTTSTALFTTATVGA